MGTCSFVLISRRPRDCVPGQPSVFLRIDSELLADRVHKAKWSCFVVLLVWTVLGDVLGALAPSPCGCCRWGPRELSMLLLHMPTSVILSIIERRLLGHAMGLAWLMHVKHGPASEARTIWTRPLLIGAGWDGMRLRPVPVPTLPGALRDTLPASATCWGVPGALALDRGVAGHHWLCPRQTVRSLLQAHT